MAATVGAALGCRGIMRAFAGGVEDRGAGAVGLAAAARAAAGFGAGGPAAGGAVGGGRPRARGRGPGVARDWAAAAAEALTAPVSPHEPEPAIPPDRVR